MTTLRGGTQWGMHIVAGCPSDGASPQSDVQRFRNFTTYVNERRVLKGIVQDLLTMSSELPGKPPGG